MLSGTTILLVRHGEKPGDPCAKDTDGDTGLSPLGVQRSGAYVDYFDGLRLAPSEGTGERVFRPDHLFAAANTSKSHRPKLTLDPLHHANPAVPFHVDIGEKSVTTLRDTLVTAKYDNAAVLICWHHGEILDVANALLAPTTDPPPTTPPADLPAAACWPTEHPCAVFGWVYQIVYDVDGAPDLDWVRCFNERLMADDTVDPPDAP